MSVAAAKLDMDAMVRAIAETQDGLVHRDQVREAGATEKQIRTRVANGAWIPVGAQAFRMAGAPDTFRSRVRAACWDAGPKGRASHGAAARLRGVPSFGAYEEVEVLMPRSSDHRCTIATVHESRRHDQIPATDLHGIPCVTMPFAVVQIAPAVTPSRIAWIVEELVNDNRLKIPSLERAFGVLGPGNGGFRALHLVLDEWSDEEAIAESKLERDFLAVARAHDLPPMQQQVKLVFRQGVEHRVDFVWPEAKLIIEVDGRRWHARRRDFDRDAVRDLEAAADGWQVIHVTWWMIRRDPADVAEKLLKTRAQRTGAA